MRYFAALLILFTPLVWQKPALAFENCPDDARALVISIQGNVQLDPAGNGAWHTARLDEKLCEGGKVWADADSRATLSLPGNDILRLNENTVLTLKAISQQKPSLLDLMKGFIHFLSRKPKEVKIESGIANAAPLGTEFAFQVDDSKASLWVYEGRVRLANAQGSVDLKSGQAADAQLGKAPQIRIDLKPEDAVAWALYYPPLLPAADAKLTDPALKTAIADYRRGRIDLALQQLDGIPPSQQTPAFFKTRGALHLLIGQVEHAQQDIRTLQASNPNDADALALQSVIALTQNRKDEALALANQAVAANPQSPTAFTALSYAEQGRFDLDKALTAAETAVKLAPLDAMSLARKAELELALGQTSTSEQTARQALSLDAAVERTQTVMGFAHLSSMNIEQAVQAFNKAVALDSAAPLPRLGLGLATIRSGNLAAGRRDIEIAAALDPNNSLIRSYLGKAYFEENRDDRAEDQFRLAKDRDPNDPTPYYYDAIRKQTTNKPVSALLDMEKAIERNDNRIVYRSKQLLDDDLAARSSAVARIYNDLGFGQRALLEGWQTVNNNPTDYSGHRLLADSYSALPRHELARTSELLQAQLLQPINTTPLQPQLGERNLAILPGSGPAGGGFNEFHPLFTKNGFGLQTSGVVGSLDTYGDEVVHSGLWDKFSYSLGQFHHESNGFRPNNRIDQNIYNAFVQGTPMDGVSLQAEYRHRDLEHGDLFYYGDLTQFAPNFKRKVETDTYRVGLTVKPTNNTSWITSLNYLDHSDNKTDISVAFPDFNKNDVQRGFAGETQFNFKSDFYSFSFGGGGYAVSNILDIKFPYAIFELPNFTAPKLNFDTGFGNVYLYNYINFPSNVTWTLGVSYETINNALIGSYNQSQVNPKLGFLWQIDKKTTLRFAAIRSLNRGLWVDSTIEPTQVAGFNQLFDNYPATSAWRYGVGLDHKLTPSMLIGAEASRRNLTQPTINIPFPPFSNEYMITKSDWEENNLRGYWYWALNKNISANLEYQYEDVSIDGSSMYKNHIMPFTLRFFDEDYGFSALATLSYINQNAIDPSFLSSVPVHSSFNLLDFGIGYRLPNRLGVIKLQMKNALDHKFNFVGQSIAGNRNNRYEETPMFVPERTFLANFTLSF